MRSFIAVKTSSEQRDKIAALIEELRQYGANVKWVKPENLHVTLKFLGDVDEKALPAIFDSLEKSLTNQKSFDFNLSALGCFPNIRKPRVFWVGINRGANELKSLARLIDDCMLGFGFAREKRGFSAHLTIGRVRDTRMIDKLVKAFDKYDFETGSCIIDEVVFFQSILKPDGPTYIPQKVIKLVNTGEEG